MFHRNLLRSLLLCAFISLIAFSPSDAQEPDPFGSHPGLREIGKLPDGIRVIHIPNPVQAHPGGRSGYKYTWKYQTTVEAMDKLLFTQEFGSFYLIKNEWVFANFTGKPFTAKDFAEWYSCPKARLRPGNPCADPSNWTGNNQLISGKMLWLFIGRDIAGNKYKGHSVIEITGSTSSID